MEVKIRFEDFAKLLDLYFNIRLCSKQVDNIDNYIYEGKINDMPYEIIMNYGNWYCVGLDNVWIPNVCIVYIDNR